MTLHVALTHRTSYRYEKLVALGPQTIRLRPAPHTRTPIISYALTVLPKPHFLNWQQDPQGNFLARVVFPERVREFSVTVDLVADMATINPFDFFLEPAAEHVPFGYEPWLREELAPYLVVEPAGPLLAELVAAHQPSGEGTADWLVALNRAVQARIAYIVRMEPGVFTPEETLTRGEGSCRDSGWLLVQALRHLGYAARFVSGYLIQLVADQKPVEGPEGPSADFTDLHAWAEVYLPGAGWVGLDPTSGLLAGEGHIPLAATPAPHSAAPVTGMMEKADVEFGFEMHVRRVRETPRVTKPYTEAQWAALVAQGARVDAALERQHVRLTMGGEPTFVAASDRDAAEWNTDAIGPTKRIFAGKLLRRLAPIWAPGAALQQTMGKHYPGEQLPRWALAAHWRRDGEPIWARPELFAQDDDAIGADTALAAQFAALLAERLQVAPDYVQPAYEDIHYYLWREQRLPANVVVEDAKLADPLERERLARVFGHGLANPVGSVLPLRRMSDNGGRRWQSGRWFVRGEHLFLSPGDAPMGLRLPLTALPWADASSIEMEQERDPMAPRTALPLWASLRAMRPGRIIQPLAEQSAPEVGREDPDMVRTALCVEPRDGKLHVFLPPLPWVEDWLALAAAVEATAGELGTPVVLEGYPPPRDPRLNHFNITPDPGVIEVNIHPAHTWDEMVSRTTDMYEAARQTGLATEKFMLDGRHVGTGGGNHVVMGAAEPADSPFLRRPDLLKSLLGFWHNHPSLSFLFSGLFIGPMSQHPRIDEARDDSLAELEIAFSQIAPDRATPPWLVDRMLRNILADMTGNTHRTEFCIDKLYAPESATGRLGLIEFRALEMPPDPHMALAPMLLMRSAIAAFWEHPYERRLIRWGSRLHDDFMLPYFVGEDFADALEELCGLGYKLDPEWFTPHAEFRFPKLGEITTRGMTLSLRTALEPWHVLGEEPAGGGTVRYVDSSVERIEARISGYSPERYVLACNGEAVTLTKTATEGEYVGGVRFKAWNPPSSLHPTIAPHAPLIFDIYDSWNGRSLGGMTHHVSHPGGRNYERFPVNANEAEARRRARFWPFGHTPGPMPPPRPHAAAESPRTLDLRRGGV
ncbi:MAG TPA: transglutaminase family protein [Acetobacteraceae bacterium]|nr:transglutaminase family protein [Acetobacteraceae bacterium]